MLLQRDDAVDRILHVVQGSVVLGVLVGVLADGQMAHQMGVVEGPFWQ